MKPFSQSRHRQCGALTIELVVAITLLTLAVLPLAFSFGHERQLLKAAYCRAVAMEIVDGEMEILAAGEWRACSFGTRPYRVRTAAASNLPPGGFQLTIAPNQIRLEWIPEAPHSGGRVTREAVIK